MALLPAPASLPVVSPIGDVRVLSSHEFSLQDRYDNAFVNQVFAKNILLTLGYIRHVVPQTADRLPSAEGSPPLTVNRQPTVDWTKVEQPFEYQVTLEPQKVLTYHAEVLPKYQQSAVPLTNVHFNSWEGFVSDGHLVGDGTCHLASLIAWTARDAGLTVEIPKNHDFAPVPDVPKADGVSIFVNPFESSTSAKRNLYIENNQNHPVTFAFSYDGAKVKVSVLE